MKLQGLPQGDPDRQGRMRGRVTDQMIRDVILLTFFSPSECYGRVNNDFKA